MEQAQAYYETPSHNIAAGVVLSLLVIFVTVLRFYVRITRSQDLKIDDWLIIPAAVATVGIGLSIIWGATRKAIGYRTMTPPAFSADPFNANTEQLTITSKIEFAYALLLPFILGCIKSSFLFFYMRIFAIDKKSKTNILLVSLIVFVIVWAIANSLAVIFGCGTYVEAHWGSTHDLEEYCHGSMIVVLELCITDFLADLFIIGIPVPLVWRLNLTMRKKIAISAVFLLGFVTVALSLARLIIEGRAVAIGFAPGSDSVLVITEYIYWGFVECSIAISTACLPTFSVLASSYVAKKWSKRVQTIIRYRWSERGAPPRKFAPPDELAPTGTDTLRQTSSDIGSIGISLDTVVHSAKSDKEWVKNEAGTADQVVVREQV